MEEQITGVGKKMPTSNSMTSFLDSMSQKETSIRDSIAAREQNERINNSTSFYEGSIQPTSAVDLRNQQHIASRGTKLAAMISQYGSDNGIPVTGTDSEVINNYIQNLNPNVRDYVAQRFHNYTHSTEYQEDSNDFALEMGWRDRDWYDYVWDGVKGLGSYLWYGFDKFGRFTKQLNDASRSTSEEDRKVSDIMNLAEERYGTLALSMPGYMDEEKWNDLQWEMDNDKVQLDKQSNPSNVLLGGGIGTVMVGAKLFPITALVDLGIGVLSQTPVSGDMLEWADEKAGDLGHYIAALPGLWQYRESLDTEEAKIEFDKFLGNMVIGILVGKAMSGKKGGNSRGGNSGGGDAGTFNDKGMKNYLRNTISKLSPEEIWKAFQERNKGKESEIKEKIYDKANKSLVNPEVWQNKQAADAYMQLDEEAVNRINKSKNKSQTLIEEFDKVSKAYENAENMIADTIEKMYGIDTAYENPISTEAGGKKYTSNKPRYYVQEWINKMKEISKFQEEQQYIDLAEQIARDGNLTPYNILEMARALSKQFDIWSVGKEGTELSNMKAEIESIRQGLKDMLKRELNKTEEWRDLGVNPLEYYDSLWSPIIGTRSNLVKLRSAWNKAKSKIADKTALNRLGTWLDKIPFTKANAARQAIDAMRGEDIMSMITKEKNIGDVLKAIKELEKKLPKDPTKEQIDAIMKDWTKNHPGAVEVIGDVIEGEVIDPEDGVWHKGRNRHLEEMFDTVDIEDPNLYLGEDSKYNGNPVDYTDKTAVTPEGYPGRPGKTTESYKGQPKGEGWTPKAWNDEKLNKYVAKWGQTVEGWVKQLEAAGVKPEAIEKLLENLSKKNFKVSSIQPPLL